MGQNKSRIDFEEEEVSAVKLREDRVRKRRKWRKRQGYSLPVGALDDSLPNTPVSARVARKNSKLVDDIVSTVTQDDAVLVSYNKRDNPELPCPASGRSAKSLTPEPGAVAKINPRSVETEGLAGKVKNTRSLQSKDVSQPQTPPSVPRFPIPEDVQFLGSPKQPSKVEVSVNKTRPIKPKDGCIASQLRSPELKDDSIAFKARSPKPEVTPDTSARALQPQDVARSVKVEVSQTLPPQNGMPSGPRSSKPEAAPIARPPESEDCSFSSQKSEPRPLKAGDCPVPSPELINRSTDVKYDSFSSPISEPTPLKVEDASVSSQISITRSIKVEEDPIPNPAFNQVSSKAKDDSISGPKGEPRPLKVKDDSISRPLDEPRPLKTEEDSISRPLKAEDSSTSSPKLEHRLVSERGSMEKEVAPHSVSKPRTLNVDDESLLNRCLLDIDKTKSYQPRHPSKVAKLRNSIKEAEESKTDENSEGKKCGKTKQVISVQPQTINLNGEGHQVSGGGKRKTVLKISDQECVNDEDMNQHCCSIPLPSQISSILESKSAPLIETMGGEIDLNDNKKKLRELDRNVDQDSERSFENEFEINAEKVVNNAERIITESVQDDREIDLEDTPNDSEVDVQVDDVTTDLRDSEKDVQDDDFDTNVDIKKDVVEAEVHHAKLALVNSVGSEDPVDLAFMPSIEENEDEDEDEGILETSVDEVTIDEEPLTTPTPKTSALKTFVNLNDDSDKHGKTQLKTTVKIINPDEELRVSPVDNEAVLNASESSEEDDVAGGKRLPPVGCSSDDQLSDHSPKSCYDSLEDVRARPKRSLPAIPADFSRQQQRAFEILATKSLDYRLVEGSPLRRRNLPQIPGENLNSIEEQEIYRYQAEKAAKSDESSSSGFVSMEPEVKPSNFLWFGIENETPTTKTPRKPRLTQLQQQKPRHKPVNQPRKKQLTKRGYKSLSSNQVKRSEPSKNNKAVESKKGDNNGSTFVSWGSFFYYSLLFRGKLISPHFFSFS